MKPENTGVRDRNLFDLKAVPYESPVRLVGVKSPAGTALLLRSGNQALPAGDEPAQFTRRPTWLIAAHPNSCMFRVHRGSSCELGGLVKSGSGTIQVSIERDRAEPDFTPTHRVSGPDRTGVRGHMMLVDNLTRV